MVCSLISNVFHSDFWRSSKCFNSPIPNVILIIYIEKLPEVFPSHKQVPGKTCFRSYSHCKYITRRDTPVRRQFLDFWVIKTPPKIETSIFLTKKTLFCPSSRVHRKIPLEKPS